MTEQIIGKVMMTFKGDYDTTKQYNFLDTVEYNGSSFVCKANGTHDTPSENSANWQLLAKAGRDGKDGINGKEGAPGKDGKDGQNGITPHIDTATGNWFVGSTDTGIKAQGPQGSPGKDGQTPDVSKLTTKTAWSETGITYINGAKAVSSSSKLKCRAITIGDVHIVQVNGWFTAGNLGNHNFLPQVQVPAFGFENDDYYFEAKGSVTSYDSFIQVDSKAKCQINLYSYSTQNGPLIPLNAMWIY